ncbi:helix-turn-helix transcriptional regulator (plasmid) [Kitasatospora sp. NBC_01246]|uniref:helix-turn-helix domain-containing protein n=1 Tax=Kitasatospora sp. NBC_01246 TaxID=2903570 RepID=UPI002E37B0D0|nr:helix-turn-helix transcriptional regulator [Kitasatospora sp. NBC_01246]
MSRQSDVHTRWSMAADGWESHPEYIAAGWRMALAGATFERRAALGWTQAQLAEAAGLTEELVEEIETSAVDPTVPVLQALGRAFQADATLALTESEPGLRFVPRAA